MKIPILILWGMMLTLKVSAVETDGYVIIVNANNPIQSISKTEIKKLYFKQQKNWPNSGLKALPIDLPSSNMIRRRFTADVLDKKMPQLGAFWHKAKANGLKRPTVIKVDKKVILKVGKFKGAIGYVKTGTKMTGKVKVITIPKVIGVRECGQQRCNFKDDGYIPKIIGNAARRQRSESP